MQKDDMPDDEGLFIFFDSDILDTALFIDGVFLYKFFTKF